MGCVPIFFLPWEEGDAEALVLPVQSSAEDDGRTCNQAGGSRFREPRPSGTLQFAALWGFVMSRSAAMPSQGCCITRITESASA